MIKTFEELGEVLAEFSNRIELLENQHTPAHGSYEEVKPEATPEGVIRGRPSLYTHLQKQLDQIKARLNYIENKYNTHLDKSKLKAEAYKNKDTYIYSSIKEDKSDAELHTS